jgi:hypothetical protein
VNVPLGAIGNVRVVAVVPTEASHRDAFVSWPFSPAESSGRHVSFDMTVAASKQERFSAIGVVVDGRRGIVDLGISW